MIPIRTHDSLLVRFDSTAAALLERPLASGSDEPWPLCPNPKGANTESGEVGGMNASAFGFSLRGVEGVAFCVLGRALVGDLGIVGSFLSCTRPLAPAAASCSRNGLEIVVRDATRHETHEVVQDLVVQH